MVLLYHPSSIPHHLPTILTIPSISIKDYATAQRDCDKAISLHSTLAIAHFRLGAAHFGLDSFDAAIASYDRALKYDAALGDQIKAKMRQVSSAREVRSYCKI